MMQLRHIIIKPLTSGPGNSDDVDIKQVIEITNIKNMNVYQYTTSFHQKSSQ